MKPKRTKLPFPKPRAIGLLIFELAIITVAAVAVLITFAARRSTDALGAAQKYLFEMEYIGTSLVIAVGGFVLVDLCERDQSQE
jgi:hypothetical protein